MIQTWLHTFASDTKVHVALLLVLADFVLGVGSALKRGSFRLAYVADLLKNDILGKLLPYLGFYILALVAGGIKILPIPGLDFGFLAGSAYVVLVTAMTASILNSAKELGVPVVKSLPGSVTADEK